jgi:hypothetical protein
MVGDGSWGMGGSVGALLGFAFWLAAIGLVMWGLRTLRGSPERRVGDDALAIVARRFGSGEISQAELELARRAHLRSCDAQGA